MAESSGKEIGTSVCALLEPRRLEVERAILARVWTVCSPAGAADDEYEAALRTAVSAGVSHGLAGIERGAEGVGPIPAALFAEARQAARSGVALDVELRRYLAAYTLFCDFIMQTVDDGLLSRGSGLRKTLHGLAVVFDRLVAAVVGEYRRESDGHRGNPGKHRFESVRKLLAGEPVGADELSYEIDDWHVGAVGAGAGVGRALQAAAAAADRRLLLVHPEPETIWAWFGGRRRIEVAEVATHLSLEAGRGDAVALGEPARGIDGWRLTQQQANAAFAIARRGEESIVQYADVGLIASVAQDRLVASSLRQLYIAPFADARDGGAALRETLKAYFTAGRNISSAASALGVSRQTVGNRLRVVEEKIGRTIESCAPEIEVALRLEEMGATGAATLGPGLGSY